MIGGCLCGDVRYAASGEPAVTSICHCLHCQKLTGSSLPVTVGARSTSKFCPRCGTAVVIEAEGFPGMALIMGGTLDDPSWLKPTMALFCDSAQPWLAINHEMTNFPRMPT